MILVSEARRAEYAAAGWWGTSTLFDHFAANVAARPDAEAVIDAPNRAEFAHGPPMRWTWSELAEQVERFCILLLGAGIGRDDIVIMQAPNTVEQFVVYLSCARLGVIISPVPVQYRENELRQILERTAASAALTFGRIGKAASSHEAAAMFLGLRAAHPSLRSVIAIGDHLPPGCIDAAAPMARPVSAAPPEAALEAAALAAKVSADDVFTICWTSGTEAAPKGVPRSHNEWLVIAPSIIESAELQAGARLLNPFPLVNMAGVSTALATWLVLGGVVVQHHPFSLKVFLLQLRDEKIDYTVAPPALLNTLLQDEALLEGIDFTRLSRIGSGSAPLSDWMVQGFADRHGVQIVNYFGSNEGAALSGSPRDIPDPKLRAQFFPRAGVEGYPWSVSTSRKIRTRLVDLDTGEDITVPGAPGELRFTGPTIFSGYFNAPELTARAFDDQGYYKTGDLFEIAGDRGEFYRFVGRSKDLVIRGGMNISAEEIENLLAGCPGVREVAVVGVPDRILGERVCVCLAATPGEAAPTLAQIVAYLREERQVAAYKLPEFVLEVDALARNPVGKVLKRELRELVREQFAPEERNDPGFRRRRSAPRRSDGGGQGDSGSLGHPRLYGGADPVRRRRRAPLDDDRADRRPGLHRRPAGPAGRRGPQDPTAHPPHGRHRWPGVCRTHRRDHARWSAKRRAGRRRVPDRERPREVLA